MVNGTCFAACVVDSDCSGHLVCRVDAYEILFSEDVEATVTACGQRVN